MLVMLLIWKCWKTLEKQQAETWKETRKVLVSHKAWFSYLRGKATCAYIPLTAKSNDGKQMLPFPQILAYAPYFYPYYECESQRW